MEEIIRRIDIGWILLGLTFLLHIPALRQGFVGDDLQILKNSEDANIEPPRNMFKRWWWLYGGQAYWVKHMREAHAIALTLHFIVCSLICYLFGPMAAALFGIHPATQEVSVWLSAKIYSMTAIVILVSWIFPVIAPLCFFVLPWEFMYFNGLPAPLLFAWKAWPWNLVTLMIVWLGFKQFRFIFNIKRNVKADAYKKNKFTKKINPSKVIIYCKFLGYAFVNGIYCMRSCYYHSYMEDYCDTKDGIAKGKKPDAYFWVGALVVYILATNLVFSPGNPALFGLYWFVLFVSMWCNFLGFGQQHIANRYYYLPYIGVAILLSHSFEAHPWVLCVLWGLNAREFIYNMRQFANGYWHLAWQAWNEPYFYYSWLLMGCLNFARGHFTMAISDWKQALDLRPDPNCFKAHFNLSSGYIARGDFKRAYEEIKRAIDSDVYAQEGPVRKILIERMNLLAYIMKNQGKVKLKIEDIPTVQ